MDRALRPEVRSPAAGLKARSRPLAGRAARAGRRQRQRCGPGRCGREWARLPHARRSGPGRRAPGSAGLGPRQGQRRGRTSAWRDPLAYLAARRGENPLTCRAARRGGRIRSPAARQGAPRRSAARGRPRGAVSGTGGPAATLGDTRPSSRHTLACRGAVEDAHLAPQGRRRTPGCRTLGGPVRPHTAPPGLRQRQRFQDLRASVTRVRTWRSTSLPSGTVSGSYVHACRTHGSARWSSGTGVTRSSERHSGSRTGP